jgi:hypothetical protein
MPFLPFESRTAENNPLINEAIIANFRGLADDDPHPMINEDPLSDLCPGMDLNASSPAVEMRD